MPSILWTDSGDARWTTVQATITDTMVIPSNTNTVLYLLMADMHNGTASTQTVTLTSETVDTIPGGTWDNSATNATEINFGAFAVRNPTAGTKTLTLTDNGLIRSFAWAGWLVSGVPASGYIDDIDRLFGDTGSNVVSLSLDTTKASGLLLALFGWRGSDKGPFSISAGWTEDADVSPGASSFTDVAYEAVSRTAPTVGNYTCTSTATLSSRRGYVAVAVLPSSNRPGSEVFIL